MLSSRSFRRPTAAVCVVAAAFGGALLPVDGVSSAAPPVGILKATGSHQMRAVFAPTNTAHGPSTSPAVPLTVTGPEEGGSLQTITSQAWPPSQSLDEPNVLDGGGLSGNLSAGNPVLNNRVTASRLPDGPLGIPGVMLGAYQRAAQTMAQTHPGCHLSWTTLAGIGEIESGHASGGRVDAAGNTVGSIRGPQLNGSPGMAAIADTDRGTLDADPGWDRAVGPMQFIPSSWRSYGAGNPHNIYDATLAAGRYLCAGGTDLSDPVQQAVAIFRYNHSATYVDNVQRWAAGYRTGVLPTPSKPGPVPQVTDSSTLPVVANLDRLAGADLGQQAGANAGQPAVVSLDQPTVANLDAASSAPPTIVSLDGG